MATESPFFTPTERSQLDTRHTSFSTCAHRRGGAVPAVNSRAARLLGKATPERDCPTSLLVQRCAALLSSKRHSLPCAEQERLLLCQQAQGQGAHLSVGHAAVAAHIVALKQEAVLGGEGVRGARSVSDKAWGCSAVPAQAADRRQVAGCPNCLGPCLRSSHLVAVALLDVAVQFQSSFQSS